MRMSRETFRLESPIEEDFSHEAIKFLREDLLLQEQVTVRTPCGNFRLDFVVEDLNRRVAFECDGKKFHDAFRDEFRDFLILNAKHVDVIYRIPGSLIYSHIHDVLYQLSRIERGLFSERSKEVLSRLASPCAKEQGINGVYFYGNAVRQVKLSDPSSERQYKRQQSLLNFCLQRAGYALDSIIDQYCRENKLPPHHQG